MDPGVGLHDPYGVPMGFLWALWFPRGSQVLYRVPMGLYVIYGISVGLYGFSLGSLGSLWVSMGSMAPYGIWGSL